MAGPNVGRECKLYYNTGTYASPTWTEIANAIDVTTDMPSQRGDVSSRGSFWAMEAKAMIGLEITFGYRRKQGISDSVYTALRGYGQAMTKFELAVADGAIATTGTQYLRATCQAEHSFDQPLTDGCSDSFTCFLTPEYDSGTLREPTWTVV